MTLPLIIICRLTQIGINARLVDVSFGEIAVMVDATIAKEWPPAAHLFGAYGRHFDDSSFGLAIRCLIYEFALRSGNET